MKKIFYLIALIIQFYLVIMIILDKTYTNKNILYGVIISISENIYNLYIIKINSYLLVFSTINNICKIKIINNIY